MKIRVIIVDDEIHARSFLRKFCERYYSDRIDVIDECNSVATAVCSIKKLQPDLVFLDVQMPDENGFELFNYFDKINFEIIFTTAHKEFAIQAIRRSALDFLVKPINLIDFKEAIKSFEAKQATKIDIDRFKLLSENLDSQFANKQRLVLPVKAGFDVIQTNSIIFCKSDGSYTYVFTVDKEFYTSKSLKDIEEMLSEPNFLRIHKSYVVNKNFISGFKTDEFCLNLTNGAIVPVSDILFSKKKLMDVLSI